MPRTLHITSTIRPPYGGVYEFKDPMLPNSDPIRCTTFEQVIRKAEQQRYANGLACGVNFVQEIEQLLCRDYPNECYNFNAELPKPRSLSITDVLHGTKVMIAHKLAGSPMVSPEEAAARAAICASNHCLQNVSYAKKCAACIDVEKLVTSIVGNASTPHDSKLNSCAVCGCALKAAVHVPLEIQAQGATDAQRETFKKIAKAMADDGYEPCWKAQV